MRRECLDENTVMRFFRGELSLPELTTIDQHIDRCSGCRVLLSSLASTQMKAAPLVATELASGARHALGTTEPSPPSSSSVAPGIVLADRFEVHDLVGVGGMAHVFRGRDRQTQARVAIKITQGRSPDEVQRFQREARLLVSLQHSAIVRHIADGLGSDGTPYIVMEWLEGEDLASRLERGRLAVGQAVTLALRVAGALAAAHELGIVHRDIKPSNIFLRGGRVEEAVVLDFGVARPSWHEAASHATRTGTLLGTLGYMAPEQAIGAKTADCRADIFSLGCVIFECLVGRRLFGGAHAVEVLANLLTQQIEHPKELAAGVPDALDALVIQMLARDRSARPPDCATVAAALERVLGEGSSLPSASPERPSKGHLRSRLVVAAGASFVVLAALFAAQRLHHSGSKETNAANAPDLTAPAPLLTDNPVAPVAPLPASPSTGAPSNSPVSTSSATAAPGPPEARPRRTGRPPSDPFGTFRN